MGATTRFDGDEPAKLRPYGSLYLTGQDMTAHDTAVVSSRRRLNQTHWWVQWMPSTAVTLPAKALGHGHSVDLGPYPNRDAARTAAMQALSKPRKAYQIPRSDLPGDACCSSDRCPTGLADLGDPTWMVPVLVANDLHSLYHMAVCDSCYTRFYADRPRSVADATALSGGGLRVVEQDNA